MLLFLNARAYKRLPNRCSICHSVETFNVRTFLKGSGLGKTQFNCTGQRKVSNLKMKYSMIVFATEKNITNISK